MCLYVTIALRGQSTRLVNVCGAARRLERHACPSERERESGLLNRPTLRSRALKRDFAGIDALQQVNVWLCVFGREKLAQSAKEAVPLCVQL